MQTMRMTELELPIGTIHEGAFQGSRYAAVGALSKEQGGNLVRLRLGLMTFGARLANGRPVQNSADALRYALEQLDPGDGAE